MFKHHKYCVIEVSGLLVGIQDADGGLSVYLRDGADGLASQSVSEADVKRDDLSIIDDKGKGVRITDPGLIEFICRQLQCSDGEHQFSCFARIAGPVGMDGGEVHLSYVSQAFIHDRERLLKYEPQ